MQLKYSVSALQDVEEARLYISLDNPSAAIRMAERIREALESLVEYPVLGRPGRVRVLHHARKWPE
jgi:plasmid stabilization system protein ParE